MGCCAWCYCTSKKYLPTDGILTFIYHIIVVILRKRKAWWPISHALLSLLLHEHLPCSTGFLASSSLIISFPSIAVCAYHHILLNPFAAYRLLLHPRLLCFAILFLFSIYALMILLLISYSLDYSTLVESLCISNSPTISYSVPLIIEVLVHRFFSIWDCLGISVRTCCKSENHRKPELLVAPTSGGSSSPVASSFIPEVHWDRCLLLSSYDDSVGGFLPSVYALSSLLFAGDRLLVLTSVVLLCIEPAAGRRCSYSSRLVGVLEAWSLGAECK